MELGMEAKGTAISGPEMYGFANPQVAALIEALPGVLQCKKYVFRSVREISFFIFLFTFYFS